MISGTREAPGIPPQTSSPLTSTMFAACPMCCDRNRILVHRWFETATDI